MTGGTNSKTFSRIVVVALMALAFAGCAVLLSSGDRSLFSEVAPTAYADANP